MHVEDQVKNMKNKKIVVVLGMHRSGTSVVARSLQVMGANLGDRLIQPIKDQNDKGFWEDKDLNSLNDEMLNALNSGWHFLTPIQPADVEKLRKDGYLVRAVAMLREKTSDLPIFGFKDPRVAKLLPFWKEAFAESGLNVSYVLAIRHPLSVSKSLINRNNFDAGKNHLLWLDHVISSLFGTIGENRVLIDYDALMQTPESELAKAAKALGLKIDKVELESFKTEFLDNQLRHTVYQPNDLLLDEAIPPLVSDIYPELLSVARSRQQLDSNAFTQKIEKWNNEFSRQKPALILADKFTREINSLHQKEQVLMAQIVEKEQQIIEREQRIADRDIHIANIKAQLADIYLSNSWRLTAPIRAISTKIRQLREGKTFSSIDQPDSDKSSLTEDKNT